jgi:malonate transporter and related proteins
VGAVFAGFATIGVLIGLGILLAHIGLVDMAGQRTLAAIAFYVASPALLIVVLSESDLGQVFSRNLATTVGAVVVTATVYTLVAVVRRKELGETVIGVLCSTYVNAGNLGVPIAAYVLGDVTLVAPVLLLQLLLLQPVALTLLDVAVAQTPLRARDVLLRPVRTPLTVATMLGVLVTVLDVRIPAPIFDPLELVSGMAVPSMLLAYGVALRLGPLPGRGVPALDLWIAVGVKTLLQPLAAYLLGRFVFGLEGHALLAVTVLSALPTAQNIFVAATRYRTGELLARDTIFVTTILSVPALLLITALLV